MNIQVQRPNTTLIAVCQLLMAIFFWDETELQMSFLILQQFVVANKLSDDITPTTNTNPDGPDNFSMRK